MKKRTRADLLVALFELADKPPNKVEGKIRSQVFRQTILPHLEISQEEISDEEFAERKAEVQNSSEAAESFRNWLGDELRKTPDANWMNPWN